MTYKELINHSVKIINGKMKLDPLSRLYGSPHFKIKKEKLNVEELYDIQDRLLEAGIYSNLEKSKRNYYLKVIRGHNPNPKKKMITHIFLFLLTIFTTALTGAMLTHGPISSMRDIVYGLPYSFALLSILLTHEMGHYFASRYYKVEVTLPYFIPIFLPTFHPGTLGAFIKMKSAIPNKKALFDIGVAGPFAGIIVSIIFLIAGFAQLPDTEGIYAHIETIHPLDNPDGINLYLGSNILYDWLASLFDGHRLPMNEVYHFPYILAGWFGLLVTALNLMPIGQLDGGHITYALFGDKARKVAIIAFGLLILLNLYVIAEFNSYVWVLWPILILFFIRFRHPPTMNNKIEIGVTRKILGWVAYFIFIICFSPLPVYIIF
ncbi:MAG: site-2 protease family protein [Calditrichaceae bacterium]|nr:site-2 protease family protein [Calditrichaceae bacterium]